MAALDLAVLDKCIHLCHVKACDENWIADSYPRLEAKILQDVHALASPSNAGQNSYTDHKDGYCKVDEG